MEMQLKSLLLFMVTIFIVLAGCKKRESLFRRIPVQSSTGNEAIEVLTTATTANSAPGVRIGTFSAIAKLGTSGTYIMQIESFGEIFHCITTFSPTGGNEFTIFSESQMYLPNGHWRILGGTGQYGNLQGSGSVVMVPGHDYYTGRVF